MAIPGYVDWQRVRDLATEAEGYEKAHAELSSTQYVAERQELRQALGSVVRQIRREINKSGA